MAPKKKGNAALHRKQYVKFISDSCGWLNVKYLEFVKTLVPLLDSKTEWNDTQAETVLRYVDEGGGYALAQLYSAKIPAGRLSEVLKKRPAAWATLKPEMHKSELESRLRGLADSCVKDSWPAARYAAYQAYLDGAALSADANLGEAKQQPPKEGGSAEATTAQAAAKQRAAEPEDLFAGMYRRAFPAYQAVVVNTFKDLISRAN